MKGPDRNPSSLKLPASTGLVLLRRSGLELVRPLHLNANWFLSLADARSKIKTWRRHYNESRPHTALGWRTPQEFALAAALQAAE